MISLLKAVSVAGIIIAVPAFGIPVYEKIAANKVVSVQESTLKNMGWKIEYSRKEHTLYGFYTTIENVSLSSDAQNVKYTADSVSLPLLPFLPVKVFNLKGGSPDYTISATQAAAVLSGKGWSDIAVSGGGYTDENYKINMAELRIDSTSQSTLNNIRAKDVSVVGFPVRIAAQNMNVDAMLMSSEFLRNTKHMLLSGISIIPENRMRQTMGDIPLSDETKVSFADYEVGGPRGAEHEAVLYIDGIKTGSSADGNSRIRLYKEGSGTGLMWETNGTGIPHMKMEIAIAGSAESVLDMWTAYRNIRPEDILRGRMEIDDSSGSVREILRQVAVKRNYPRHQTDLLLPLMLVHEGTMAREGGVAVWNWLKDPGRKLVINLISPGQNLKMQASLIQ